MTKKIIVVAGSTGNLGGRIVKALLAKGVEVRAFVRPGSDLEKVERLKVLGAIIVSVDLNNVQELSAACSGAACVVSALAGLEDVIIDKQKNLLNAAILAGVPRFIPSDFSLDFTKFDDGENRNLDIRRVFHTILDASPIAATSIFNGAFMDMLANEIPMIIFKRKLILYWGEADHKMAFTTMDDTALYTADAAIDTSTPRYLRIAGDQISPSQIREVMLNITGQKYRLLKTGGAGLLNLIIKITKTLSPGKNELYPAWQGMQYMRNMIDKRSKLESTDNDRYVGMNWTSVNNFISTLPASTFQTSD